MDIYLVRHGQTDGNVGGVVMGRGAHPLNTEGKAQVRRLAKFLKDIHFDAFYVSPSRRAMQTAQILMRGRDTVPFVEEAGLDEIDYGDWVGKEIKDVLHDKAADAYLYDPDNVKLPGSESIPDVRIRSSRVVEKLLLDNSLRKVMLVSHADVIKTILIHFLDLPLKEWQKFRVDNASLTILQFKEGWKPRAFVINGHPDAGRYCS